MASNQDNLNQPGGNEPGRIWPGENQAERNWPPKIGPGNPAPSGPSDDVDDRLVTVYEGRSEFEANAIAATLRNLGFYAAVVNTGQATFPIQGIHRTGIPVWVRERDREAAAAALKRNRADSVDIDWADVDVGQMEEGAPPVKPEFGQRIGGYGPAWRAIRNFGFIAISFAFAMLIVPRGYVLFAFGLAIFLWGVSLFDQEAIRRTRSRMAAGRTSGRA